MKTQVGSACLFCTFIAAAGCGSQDGPSHLGGPGEADEGTGTIRASVTGAASDGLAYLRIDLSRSGTIIASQTIALGAAGGDAGAPPPGAPTGDAYFVEAPGIYGITVTALDAQKNLDTACKPVSGSAVIAASVTTEVSLTMTCSGPASGGVDVGVTVEGPPVITGLTFDPSKFVSVCEPVTVTVQASDPGGLPLSYSWTIYSQPGPLDAILPPSIKPNGASATFDTSTAGNYTLQVVVIDSMKQEAQLNFPVHVLPGTCQGAQQLSGYRLGSDTKAPLVGPLAASTPMHMAIGLPTPDSAGLATFVSQVSNPTSATYRQYLTPDQFAASYGASQSDYDAIVAFAQAHGLTVEGSYSNRLLVDVGGTAAAFESAFYVNLNEYKRADGTVFFAPDRQPSMDTPVPVLRISGFDNFVAPTPLQTGSGPGGSFQGNDFRNAYASCTTMTGAGQRLGIFAPDGFLASDIVAYEMQTGITVPVFAVPVNGVSGQPSGTGRDTEVALDIEVPMGLAPGLDAIVVYEGDPGVLNSIFSAMATTLPLAKSLSVSWGFNVDENTRQLFAEFAAQGQSIAVASGDDGGYTSPPQDLRALDLMTLVGGTQLTMVPPGASYGSEAVWPGSGGGIVAAPSPPYQMGLDVTQNLGSSTQRDAPDISMVAFDAELIGPFQDPGVTCASPHLCSEQVQGTSIATPLWAAFVALANQDSEQNGFGSLGFVNPLLYARAQESGAYGSTFTDINGGSNGPFPAVAGYDLATGWGSPRCALVHALALPPAQRALEVTLSNIDFHTTGYSAGDHPPTYDTPIGVDLNGDVTIRCRPFANGSTIDMNPQVVTQDIGCANVTTDPFGGSMRLGVTATVTCSGEGTPGLTDIIGSVSIAMTQTGASNCSTNDSPITGVSFPTGSIPSGTFFFDVNVGTPLTQSTSCPPLDETAPLPQCVRSLDVCWPGNNIDNPPPCTRQEFGADIKVTNVMP